MLNNQENCSAIAFNKTGDLMVAGCDECIKVYQFENGRFSKIGELIEHTDYINCLVFSKKSNWFASCSNDQTIKCWYEQGCDWTSVEPVKKHGSYVICLLLNLEETKLISCGGLNIKVWRLDGESIEYYYTLDRKHTGLVTGISLNFSETALVSCSKDGQIILWMIGQNQQWKYINDIQIALGYRICFVSDTQIFFQPAQQSQTQIISIENKMLIKQNDLNINLNEATQDAFLFPTIYNKKKQLIIQKYGQYVYIVKAQVDGSFNIVFDPIDCYSAYNFGQLTQDGQYLVLWNEETREFKVYFIEY